MRDVADTSASDAPCGYPAGHRQAPHAQGEQDERGSQEDAERAIVYLARHGNPFVIRQEVEIALHSLLARASAMPDCSFSDDVAELLKRKEDAEEERARKE